MKSQYKISSCPVCGHGHFTPFLHVNDWLVSKEEFKLLQCNHCKFVFTSNAPAEQHISPYYNSEEYIEHSDTSSGLIYGIYHHARKLMLRYKLKKIRQLNTGKKLLDIGSGSGYFMNHMHQNGFEVNGVEISEKAIALCQQKFKITAHKPSEFLAGKLARNYDIITLWHVFEHVYSFNEYMRLFSDSLNDDGYLLLALPNHESFDANYYSSYWCAYDTPRHLWHFTPKTLEKHAHNFGFKLVRKHRLPLDPFFNAMVSASYKKSTTFLPFTLLIGLVSYVKSLSNVNKSSSIIYVLKKET